MSSTGFYLVDLPDVPVEGPHGRELVLAMVTRRVAGVILLVAGNRFWMVEDLGANITYVFYREAVLKIKSCNGRIMVTDL